MFDEVKFASVERIDAERKIQITCEPTATDRKRLKTSQINPAPNQRWVPKSCAGIKLSSGLGSDFTTDTTNIVWRAGAVANLLRDHHA
jgi:hypothetical protein